MLLFEEGLAERGCLLLWLLPVVLKAQSSEEVRPGSMPCQQSPTKVSCRGAGLSDFPKELGQGLRHLELSHNFIQSLSGSSVAGLGQLEQLDLSFNQLEAVSDTALVQLPRLRSLLAGSNHLDHNYTANGRAFHLLTNLELLDLSRNNLESHMAACYISNLTSLRLLDLSGNKVTKVPSGIFRSTPGLRELDLSNNYLMEIEEGAFEALEELEVLNLALNSLHCVTGFGLTQLRVLNLSHNALELFGSEEGAESSYQLRVLDLSHNRLLYFPALPKAHHLTHLNLSNNLIASLLPGSGHAGEFVLPYEEMGRVNRTWHMAAGLTRVADLDLSNNHLELFPFPFFHSLGSLHSLSLAMNCLQDVTREPLPNGTEPRDHWPSLSVRWLDLHDNAIHLLPPWFFLSLPQLEAIDLSSNSLQPCESQGMDQEEISEADSSMPAPRGTCTSFYNVPHLKHLSLSKNNISRLHPYTFNQTSLLSLDLSQNIGLSVHKEALRGLEFSLQNLSLRGNQMDDSEAELPCLETLRALDLSGNHLSLLPAGLLCSPLESLDVGHNNLLALEEAGLRSWSHSLQAMAIAGNPFSCCSLAWLDLLQESGVDLRDLDQALCTYQDESRNFSAKLSSSPRWLCPSPRSTTSTLALLVLLMSLLFLSIGACCLLKKGRKLAECAGLRSNKVFPHQPDREEPAEVKPAESVTKV